MGKWAGAYRADKRRKELDRIKHREDKEKRLAERRAVQKEYDIAHGIIPPDPVDPAAAPAVGTPAPEGATVTVTAETVKAGTVKTETK